VVPLVFSDIVSPAGFFALCCCTSLLAFAAFALDKRRAKRNGWRIPENTLLLLALFGPFGALLAMQLFRHKTRHAKFALVYVFALVHAGLFLWLLWQNMI
jgi:uncharacterized membrane protein YsdA (DUF1294 family)